MHQMAQQLIAQLKMMAAIDFENTPTFKFIGKLKAALVANNFTVELAETIALTMEVRLPEGSLDEDQLTEIAGLYAGMIGKLYDGLAKNGFTNPTDGIVLVAKSLSLTMD